MIKPGTILECSCLGPHGKPVVAVIGYNDDWAVYEQSYPDQTNKYLIANNGDKVSAGMAEQLFLDIDTNILRYRR